MNGNRSSCPDDKVEAVARFIHVVKNMNRNEFEAKYINESSDHKMECSSNDVKDYLEEWNSYNDWLDDLLDGLDCLCNNAAVSELANAIRLYSKKQGQVELKLERLGIQEDSILNILFQMDEKNKKFPTKRL